MRSDSKIRKVANCALLIALAMVLSYVEALIPINFGIPGVKLGIPNLVIVVGLYLLKPHEVFIISMLRVILVAAMWERHVADVQPRGRNPQLCSYGSSEQSKRLFYDRNQHTRRCVP